jgi:hypothetical protein
MSRSFTAVVASLSSTSTPAVRRLPNAAPPVICAVLRLSDPLPGLVAL